METLGGRAGPRLQWHQALPWNDELSGAESRIRASLDLRYQDRVVPLSNRIQGMAEAFAHRWGVPGQAVTNFLELGRGNRCFPVVLMQNPTQLAETLPFWDMVDRSPTLCWVEAKVREMYLAFSEVVIIDACPLLSDERLRLIEARERSRTYDNGSAFVSKDRMRAISEAYAITREVLREIQPACILSCQCATRGQNWYTGDPLMALLCSSTRSAGERAVRRVECDGRVLDVIMAYHPSHMGFVRRENGALADHRETELRYIFIRTFHSCGIRKAQALLLKRIWQFVTELRDKAWLVLHPMLVPALVMDIANLLGRHSLPPQAEAFFQDKQVFVDAWTELRSSVLHSSNAVVRTVHQLFVQITQNRYYPLQDLDEFRAEIVPHLTGSEVFWMT